MEVRITQSAAIDFKGNGRIESLVPGKIMTVTEEEGEALVRANLAVEVDEREPETATAAPQRKRR